MARAAGKYMAVTEQSMAGDKAVNVFVVNKNIVFRGLIYPSGIFETRTLVILPRSVADIFNPLKF